MTTAAADNDAFVMPSIVGSFFAHVVMLIAIAAAVAPLRVNVDDEAPDDRGYAVSSEPFGWSHRSDDSHAALLAQAAEFSMTGLPGASDEGSMADPEGRRHDKRYGVSGPADNPDPHLADARGFQYATCLGGVGMDPHVGGDPHAPIAPWGRHDSLGQDRESARGLYWSKAIGTAAGSSSVGMRGLGNEDSYGDGSGALDASYVHRCRLQ